MKIFKIFFLITFLVLISPQLVEAQVFEWAKEMNGVIDVLGKAISIDASGNSYITGYFDSTATFGTTTLRSYGRTDIFVAKFDDTGNCFWAKQAGGTNVDYDKGKSNE